MGEAVFGKRFIRRSKSGEPPYLPMAYVMLVPMRPATMLTIRRKTKGVFNPAATPPAKGSTISLEIGKQAYSSKIRKKIPSVLIFIKDLISERLATKEATLRWGLVNCIRDLIENAGKI